MGPVKIMHIDPDFNVTYLIFQPGASIHSPLSIQQAIQLLKTEKFDLILSEPHHKAILAPQNFLKEANMNYSPEVLN